MITISKGNQNKIVSPGSEKGKTKEESFSSTALGSTIERKSIANDDTVSLKLCAFILMSIHIHKISIFIIAH